MKMTSIHEGMTYPAQYWSDEWGFLFNQEVVALLKSLHNRFEPRRQTLLKMRIQNQQDYDSGKLPDFLSRHSEAVSGNWSIDPLPDILKCRRVEITGPVNSAKIVCQMLSRTETGERADTAMLDFEDSMKPDFINVLTGYKNVIQAASGIIRHVEESPESKSEKIYSLNPEDMAFIMVRVRGLHLHETHLLFDGIPLSAGMVDLVICFYHTCQIFLKQGKTPKYYIPKCEHFLEARWWNDLFSVLEDFFSFKRGTIKVTFLIETLPAAFQAEEILYEIKEHAAGLNVGRWDKIFSDIKVLKNHPDRVLADRSLIDLKIPWMENYAKRIIKICHARGALAIGGMSAFTPGKTAKVREEQAMKVLADKQTEASWGHDGCWVSHPFFIGYAMSAFKTTNQLDVKLENFDKYSDILPKGMGPCTLKGLRKNITVGIAYIYGWNHGLGCISLDLQMEDLATLEISRAQTWQWLHHHVTLSEGMPVTEELIQKIFNEEFEELSRDWEMVAGEIGKKEALWQAKKGGEFLFLKPDLATFMMNVFPINKIIEPFKRIEMNHLNLQEADLEKVWKSEDRWVGIIRNYTSTSVLKLRGSFHVEHTLARNGSNRLWEMLHENKYTSALGALTGNQAVQQVRAGLQAIYLSGWQVAADANLAGQMYPDQSLYPSNSVPEIVKRINQSLQRADQIESSDGHVTRNWMVPIVADAEAGFGGPLNAFELMKSMIEAGAAGVHFEDQLASEKKCGHLGGKVLIPTSQFIRTLTAARLAADVLNVPTILIARTDAQGAQLLTSDVDERDRHFLTGERTSEGFYRIKEGLNSAIARGLAYAPYADIIWCETSKPDLKEAKLFAEAIHQEFPGKFLAYNCSPSFNWKKNLSDAEIANFQMELGNMGYKFQFITLAGFHSLNFSMFELALDFKDRGMTAYSNLQEKEFSFEKWGYTATKHQHEVGTSYFDEVSSVISGGVSSTLAYKGSTENQQFTQMKM